MGIPDWLAQLTGAYGQQASHGGGGFSSGNATAPTIMDALGGIGHDMMEHYRAGPGQSAAGPTASAGQTLAPPTVAQPLHYFMQPPPAPAQGGGMGGGLDLTSIMKILGGMHGAGGLPGAGPG